MDSFETSWSSSGSPCMIQFFQSDAGRPAEGDCLHSLYFDVVGANGIAPPLALGVYARGELCRRACGGIAAFAAPLSVQLGLVDHSTDGLLEFRNDTFRRALGRDQAVEGVCVIGRKTAFPEAG